LGVYFSLLVEAVGRLLQEAEETSELWISRWTWWNLAGTSSCATSSAY